LLRAVSLLGFLAETVKFFLRDLEVFHHLNSASPPNDQAQQRGPLRKL
jgi:hypothetical protein